MLGFSESLITIIYVMLSLKAILIVGALVGFGYWLGRKR